MDTTTNDVTSTESAIAALQAQIADLNGQIQTLRRQAEAEAVQAQVAGIAAELETTPERVAAFLATVADRSGYGLGYLVSVVTGEHRVSTPASRSW